MGIRIFSHLLKKDDRKLKIQISKYWYIEKKKQETAFEFCCFFNSEI